MDIQITDPDKIWELRLYLGDIGDQEAGEDQLLQDKDYQYFINKNTNKDGKYAFKKTLMNCALSILAYLTRGGARQRIGGEEIFGKELVDSWLLFLKTLQDPKFNGSTPSVYVGGTVRSATEYLATNPDYIDPPFYRGQQNRSPYWETRRTYFLDTVIEPVELKRLTRGRL